MSRAQGPETWQSNKKAHFQKELTPKAYFE